MTEKFKLKSSIKYPTSLIIRGNDFIGVEIAKSLIEQGGYVVVIDHDVEATLETYKSVVDKKLLTVIDFSAIEYLDEDLRRLDYVFFLGHNFDNPKTEISSQEFLQSSNYLDAVIKLANKFEAKFLLTSSIKAHQLLMQNSDLDMNFGEKSIKKHIIYTQAEIQRYSEALVLESIDKLDLDARVARLGHVIGKGMEFDLSNSYDKLVFQAIQGKDLKIEKDGLETNMYVHVLDAAYGLIKAMFTKGTKGKVFSVSNEEEVTDLSIAYKLQELLGLDVEIKFIDTREQIPPIRFYKPALNLTTIGWVPRIPFIRAISQSVDYAIELYNKKENEQNSQNDQTQNNDMDEINGMSDGQLDDEPKGALARLIAERKKQEKARKGSILMAHEKVQAKTRIKRDFSTSERIVRKMQVLYDRIAYKFTFLKKITIVEAIFYLFSFIIFAFIYVGLISPLFVIGKNVISIEYYKPKLTSSIQDGKYQTAYQYSTKIDTSVSALHDNYSKLEIEAKIIGQFDAFSRVNTNLQYAENYSHEMNSSIKILSDFDLYWSTMESGIKYVPNANSTLVMGNPQVNVDYEKRVQAYQSQIPQSVKKIDLTSAEMKKDGSVKIFQFNTSDLAESFDSIKNNVISSLNYAKNYSGLVIDDNADSNVYAFILQDNSKYTPSGGYPAGIGYVQVKNGKVTQIYLAPINSANNKVITELSDAEFREIQMASTSVIEKNQIKFSQLFLIEDKEVISNNITDYYKENFDVNPKLIFYVNLDTLSNALDVNGAIEFNQVKVDKNTLLSSINLLQSGDKSSDKRNQIITNVFAAELANITNSDNQIYKLLPLIYSSSKNRSAWATGKESDLLEKLFTSVSNETPADWMQVSLVADPQSAEVNILPSITVAVKDTVNKDFTVTRQVDINQSNLENLEKVIICVSSGAKDFSLDDSPVSLGQSFTNNKTCVSGEPEGSAKAISFRYKITRGVENLGEGKYNKSLDFKSTSGLDANYEYEADFDDAFTLESNPSLVVSNQKVLTTGNLEQDQLINIKFTK